MNRLSLINICVNKDGQSILKETNAEVPSGKLSAIIGPNGAGKTTLLRILAGLEPPTSGAVYTNSNTSIHNLSPLERARKIAWLPENNYIPFAFTTFETVLLGRFAWHHGHPSQNDRIHAYQALKTLNIQHLEEKNITILSNGERQKVAIARALAAKTEILLLDEPFANLDIAASIQLMKLFHRLVSDGITICLSLHDVSLAWQNTDHVIALKTGQIQTTGPTKKVLTPQKIKDIFGLEPEIVTSPKRKETLIF